MLCIHKEFVGMTLTSQCSICADCTLLNAYYINNNVKEAAGSAADNATERIKRILDAKYEKADLAQAVATQMHLDSAEQDKLL